jgi:MFS family permease
MRAAIWRAAAFFAPGAAPWAMLPLVVREQLQDGAGIYGVLLGLMGIGGVTAGLVLPQLRARFARGNIVFGASLLSYGGMAVLGLSRHWGVAGLGMLMFGLGWVTTASVTQGAAQMAAPAWVRSRALAIYQLSFNFALAMGTFFWGWLGTQVGLTEALVTAAIVGAVLALAVRGVNIDAAEISFTSNVAMTPTVEAIAPELAPTLAATRGRVLESQHYRIAPENKDAFLRAMVEVRDARARGGAVQWHLGEDIHAPEHWVELWWVENWTDHLREAGRLSEVDRAILARAMAFHVDGDPPATRRFLSINPHHPPAA